LGRLAGVFLVAQSDCFVTSPGAASKFKKIQNQHIHHTIEEFAEKLIPQRQVNLEESITSKKNLYTMATPCSINTPTVPKVTPQRKHRVSFSKISIFEFPYAIGDTPCSSGVPIGASYTAQHQMSLSLDHFETNRPQRRSKVDLHISAINRKML
jgi:hypothetical protein